MTINLTPEQEQRIEAMIHSGAYQSIEDVVEAALAAVEQRAVPGFEGSEAELDALLIAGLDSPELGEEEFWNSIGFIVEFDGECDDRERQQRRQWKAVPHSSRDSRVARSAQSNGRSRCRLDAVKAADLAI